MEVALLNIQIMEKLSTSSCLPPWAGGSAVGAGEQESQSGVRGEPNIPEGEHARQGRPYLLP